MSTARERCSRPRSACCRTSRREIPGLSRAALEGALGDGLGVRQVVWLGRGIAGDDTHGHIDDVCRFVAPGVVVLCSETDPQRRQLPAVGREP